MVGADMVLDTAAVEAHLSAELGDAVVGTEVLHDGLNLSLAVSTEAAGRAYVLRRPNKLRDHASFNDVEQEYRVLQRLQGTAIDAPEPVLVCLDESVIGAPFLVTTYLDGEPVPLGTDLPQRFRTPSARRRFGTLIIDTLADLHSVATAPFADVCDRQTVRDQLGSVTGQLEAATSVTGHEPPALWDVADWLQRHAPDDSTTALVHGDYRPGNVLFAGTDRPSITGVLDWETAFLGDPLTELGYLLLRWRDEGDPTPSLDAIGERYPDDDSMLDLEKAHERGLAPYTSDPGSPSRRELVARYEEQTGRRFEHERFYRALAAFILATVWQDLDRYQVAAGAEPERGPLIDYLSMQAERIVSGDFPL